MHKNADQSKVTSLEHGKLNDKLSAPSSHQMRDNQAIISKATGFPIKGNKSLPSASPAKKDNTLELSKTASMKDISALQSLYSSAQQLLQTNVNCSQVSKVSLTPQFLTSCTSSPHSILSVQHQAHAQHPQYATLPPPFSHQAGHIADSSHKFLASVAAAAAVAASNPLFPMMPFPFLHTTSQSRPTFPLHQLTTVAPIGHKNPLLNELSTTASVFHKDKLSKQTLL